MCTQQLSVLHWIIHWYQKFTFHNKKSYICWLDATELSSSCETQVIMIEMV